MIYLLSQSCCYMRRRLHQGKHFKLYDVVTPYRWPSREDAPWIRPLSIANIFFNEVYGVSHNTRIEDTKLLATSFGLSGADYIHKLLLHKTTNTFISNLKNSSSPYLKLSNTNSRYKTKNTIFPVSTKDIFLYKVLFLLRIHLPLQI